MWAVDAGNKVDGTELTVATRKPTPIYYYILSECLFSNSDIRDVPFDIFFTQSSCYSFNTTILV